MFKFRIIIWRDGGFWLDPQYAVGRDTADVRRRLVKQHGEKVAANSAVTVIAPHPIDREVVEDEPCSAAIERMLDPEGTAIQ